MEADNRPMLRVDNITKEEDSSSCATASTNSALTTST